jgi:hypothetical protein
VAFFPLVIVSGRPLDLFNRVVFDGVLLAEVLKELRQRGKLRADRFID